MKIMAKRGSKPAAFLEGSGGNWDAVESLQFKAVEEAGDWGEGISENRHRGTMLTASARRRKKKTREC